MPVPGRKRVAVPPRTRYLESLGMTTFGADMDGATAGLGKRRWAIAEGYIPGGSVDPDDRTLASHEVACLLNLTSEEAEVTLTVFFEDRDPVGPYRIRLGARRTLHLRFNDLSDPEPIPRDTPYASIIESSVPIIVQHTRLDSRHANIALLSTMAWALD